MRKKVLMVDDSSTVLMVEKMILSKGPYDLVTARDGIEAIAKSKSEQPDVILLDVVMPNLDGLSACHAIRNEPSTSHIPIVMVTTRGEEVNIETAFRNGRTDYVTKPINGLELMAKLQSILGLGAANDKVIGAIGIFSLQQQKQKLEPVDYELFDLLGSHAASALFCARLYQCYAEAAQ